MPPECGSMRKWRMTCNSTGKTGITYVYKTRTLLKIVFAPKSALATIANRRVVAQEVNLV